MAEDEVVSIAVLGVTGAGKSSFARLVSQESSIVIGHSLKAETRTTTSYRFEHNGTVYEIVDCPGFNDTIRPDEEILEDIQSWLYNADRQGRLLSAVIFLHRISDIRVQGSTSLQFRVLQALCGDDFYENLLLGTTFWGKVDEDEGAAREASLCETRNFFGEMMELGAWYVRIPDDRRGCLELLENIRANQRRRLKAQEEMENDDDIKRTSASETLRTAQETVSGFDRQLQVLWMRVSGHAYVAAIISMDYLFFAFRQLLVYGQDMYRQAQVWWRQLSDWKTVRDMAFQTSPALTTLIGRADSLQKQLRQLESNDPIAMERKRQKREMALEKWRQAKVEAEARWETAHLAWERRAEEALRDYDRSSSFLGMPMKEGHFMTLSSCSQPNCGASLWREAYRQCTFCGSRWCVDCRKDQRIIHSSDCPFAKQYGGKSRAEALKNCFKEREPTLRLPDKPLDLSFASGLLIAVAVLAGLVLLGAVRDHWPEARSGLLWFPRFLFFLVRFFIRAPFSICAGILVGLVNLVGMVIGFIIGILIAALQLVFSVANIPIYLCSIILREIGYFTLAA